MQVLLIHPLGNNWIPGRRDATEATGAMAPLGLCCLAAYLETRGVEARILDLYARRRLGRSWLDQVEREQPEWVGLSCTTSSFLDGIEAARLVRDRLPDVRIVVGGVHLSSMPEELLARYPEIDFGVVGEGEETFWELISGGSPREIPGLVWRDGSRVVLNPRRELLADLDHLPFPAYHRLPGFPRLYQLPLLNYPRGPGATISSSRGCPYQCSYCDRSVFRQGFRAHSAEWMLDQMEHLNRRFGIRHINFYDDLFTYDRHRVTAFCEGLIQRRLGMTFNCALSTRHAGEDLLEMLHRAGCWMISVGIESGDPELLARHKSGGDLSAVADLVHRARTRGLRVKGLFMMGLPGETPSSFQQTMEMVDRLQLDDLNLARFTPFPGAPIWEGIRREGELQEDWPLMNCMNFVFVPRGYRDRAQMEDLYNRAVRGFYRSWRVRRAMGRLVLRHPHHAWRVIRGLPALLSARAEFAR